MRELLQRTHDILGYHADSLRVLPDVLFKELSKLRNDIILELAAPKPQHLAAVKKKAKKTAKK